MNEVFERYLAQCWRDKPATQERRRYWLSSLRDFCQKRGIDLRQFSAADINHYQQQLEWSPGPRGVYSPSTIHQGLSMLRIFLRWAFAQGLLSQDPTANWVLGSSPTSERRLLSRIQLDAALNGWIGISPVSLRDRALLHIFAELGIFAEDCRRLDIADVNLAGFRLTGIPLSANLLEHLQTYLRKGRPALLTDPCETALFLSRTGLRMESYRIRAIAGCRGGPLVTASLLRRSWLAHRDASSGRRLTEF